MKDHLSTTYTNLNPVGSRQLVMQTISYTNGKGITLPIMQACWETGVSRLPNGMPNPAFEIDTLECSDEVAILLNLRASDSKEREQVADLLSKRAGETITPNELYHITNLLATPPRF